MVFPLSMAKDQSYQVSSQNSKNKGNFWLKILNFRHRLLNKLGLLVAKWKTVMVVPPGMAKDQSYQVSAPNLKKGNFWLKNLNFRLRLLNKLSPLVAKWKTAMVVPPGMSKDQSCKVSSQNSENKGNFLLKNLDFVLRLLNKVGPLVAKSKNRHGGPSGYGQGPILPSFIPKLQKQRQLSDQ